ncbi:MAG: hypothetical protein ACLTSX_02680 [Collinsella sp.]
MDSRQASLRLRRRLPACWLLADYDEHIGDLGDLYRIHASKPALWVRTVTRAKAPRSDGAAIERDPKAGAVCDPVRNSGLDFGVIGLANAMEAK